TAEALQRAADLSSRHLTERRLPDKAIDLIDEAGAAAKLKDKAGKKAGAPKRKVGAKEIETVVATMAKIPPRRVAGDDRKRLQDLEGDLKAKIYGQDGAVMRVAQAIKMNRA